MHSVLKDASSSFVMNIGMDNQDGARYSNEAEMAVNGSTARSHLDAAPSTIPVNSDAKSGTMQAAQRTDIGGRNIRKNTEQTAPSELINC